MKCVRNLRENLLKEIGCLKIEHLLWGGRGKNWERGQRQTERSVAQLVRFLQDAQMKWPHKPVKHTSHPLIPHNYRTKRGGAGHFSYECVTVTGSDSDWGREGERDRNRGRRERVTKREIQLQLQTHRHILASWTVGLLCSFHCLILPPSPCVPHAPLPILRSSCVPYAPDLFPVVFLAFILLWYFPLFAFLFIFLFLYRPACVRGLCLGPFFA